MEWLNNLISGENGSAINLVLITLAIAILLIVIVWIFRKITGTAARRAMRSRVPRLSITDSTTVDDKRYLVMVRRDNVEHLLLIGGANDIVVESNIVRAQVSQKQPVATKAISPAPAPKAPSEPEIEETTSSIGAPIAGVAAAGAAGLTAATTMTSNAATAVADTTADIGNAAVESVSNVTQSVSDTVADTTSSVGEQSSEAIDTVVESISLDLEPEMEAPEVVESLESVEIEAPEVDLESAISAKLDDALSVEALDIDVSEAPETQPASKDEGDDEMQRLLNELSGEVKEPAQ